MKKILLITVALVGFANATVSNGDILQISIKGVPQGEQAQVNGTYQVSNSGKIHLPYLSTTPISAKGVSTTVVARRIEAAYKKAEIYTTPTISIQSVTDERKLGQAINDKLQRYLTVSGKVGRPGPQVYRPGMKLIDVVSAANPTTFAAQNRVELLRNGKKYTYNMKIPAHMLVPVYPNDQITLNEKRWNGT